MSSIHDLMLARFVEISTTVQQLEDAKREIELLKGVLIKCRHNLVTLNGLIASDRLDAYHDALRDGVSHDDAWAIFCETTQTIDEVALINSIDAVLSSHIEGVRR